MFLYSQYNFKGKLVLRLMRLSANRDFIKYYFVAKREAIILNFESVETKRHYFILHTYRL